MLVVSMSTPQISAVCASAAKWRSVRPAPQPKSSTLLPANVQPAGSRSRIAVRVSGPSFSHSSAKRSIQPGSV